jgi:EmrB/QacA subfamily drug resistance transporter
MSPRSPVPGFWILLAAILGSSLVFIDGTVVNVVLPFLQTSLGATVFGVQWVVEAYALFLSALLLLGGALGDSFGRRRIFGLGMLVFAGSSVWCGLSPGITSLIVARAVQGIGGALLTPGSLALISASFPEQERGRAIGTWSGFSGMAAALGPIVGGWLIDTFSWRWAFLVNVPLTAVALTILYLRVPESRDEQRQAGIDVPGAMLVTLGLFAIVFGLIEASRRGFASPLVIGSLTSGFVLLVAFLCVEAFGAAPMVPLELFRSVPFTCANLLTFLLYGALGGLFFFLPLNLIQVHRYSATGAGAVLLPFIVVVFLLSRWAGGLVERYGPRLPLTVGPAIAAVGFALLALLETGGSYLTTFFPAIAVLGLGMAITIAPLTTTVMNAVEVRYAGVASGVNNAVSRAAGLVAVAVFGIVLYRNFNASLDGALAALNLPTAVKDSIDEQRIRLAAIELPGSIAPTLRTALQTAIARAFLDGFRRVVQICAMLALASALVAALGFPSKSKIAGAAEKPRLHA